MRIAFVLQLVFLCSCANNGLVKEVEKFIGQQITFSSDGDVLWKGRDTVVTGFVDAPIKLVIWYDSFGCISCEARKMFEWNSIVADANTLAPWVKIIYLFTPQKEDLHGLTITLKADRFDYPVFIDQNATFVKQNPKLSKNRQLHSFLLDKDNRVVMVGSPLHNPVLWGLYKKTIQKMIDNDGLLPSP